MVRTLLHDSSEVSTAGQLADGVVGTACVVRVENANGIVTGAELRVSVSCRAWDNRGHTSADLRRVAHRPRRHVSPVRDRVAAETGRLLRLPIAASV
jgi:hypothetical protein